MRYLYVTTWVRMMSMHVSVLVYTATCVKVNHYEYKTKPYRSIMSPIVYTDGNAKCLCVMLCYSA